MFFSHSIRGGIACPRILLVCVINSLWVLVSCSISSNSKLTSGRSDLSTKTSYSLHASSSRVARQAKVVSFNQKPHLMLH